jgi:serine/threonine protein kinase
VFNLNARSPASSLPDPKDNILIDSNGNARLAGFKFITITSDQSTTTPPSWSDETQGVDPVLFEPGGFGSKEADCFGLGVVIYEVLSGQSPFPKSGSFSDLMKAVEGKRPERPQGKDGELFTDDIWDILELCWKHQPRDRIGASAALLRLEGHPPLSRPFFNVAAMASRIYSAMTGRIPIPVRFLHPTLGPPLLTLALSQDRQLRVGTTDSQFHHGQLIQGGDGLDAPGEGSKLPLKALKNLTIPGGYTL